MKPLGDNMIARLVVIASILAALACGTTGKSAREAPPVPPVGTTAAAPPKDAYLDDVKTAVAAQLECPVEQINVTCIRRDSQGECISVRGDGCERTVEYQFGDG